MAKKSKAQIIKSEVRKRKSFVNQIKIHVEKIMNNHGNLEVINYWENEIVNNFLSQVAVIDTKLKGVGRNEEPSINELEEMLNLALER